MTRPSPDPSAVRGGQGRDAVAWRLNRSVGAPHEYIPDGPVETAPLGRYCLPEVRQEAFAAILEGFETGAYDYRIVAWLAQLDDPTCRTIASLMWRCRLAGAGLALSRSRPPTSAEGHGGGAW